MTYSRECHQYPSRDNESVDLLRLPGLYRRLWPKPVWGRLSGILQKLKRWVRRRNNYPSGKRMSCPAYPMPHDWLCIRPLHNRMPLHYLNPALSISFHILGIWVRRCRRESKRDVYDLKLYMRKMVDKPIIFSGNTER